MMQPATSERTRRSITLNGFFNFFLIAFGLVAGFLACTGLAIHFSQTENAHLAPYFGWASIGFLGAAMFWISWDYD
jgi:hypothetical protein